MLNHIKYYKEIDSTNRSMSRSVEVLPDRTVFIADKQTQGRGRYGRSWQSDNPGNLYMSLLLKDHRELIQSAQHLTIFSALVTMECLDLYLLPTGHKASMKWPNDIVVEGKKISGILAECSWWGQQLQHVVIGIGVNLAMTKSELDQINQPCTSLNLETNLIVDRDVFAKQWLGIFFTHYHQFIAQGLQFIKHTPDTLRIFPLMEAQKATNNQRISVNKYYQQPGDQ